MNCIARRDKCCTQTKATNSVNKIPAGLKRAKSKSTLEERIAQLENLVTPHNSAIDVTIHHQNLASREKTESNVETLNSDQKGIALRSFHPIRQDSANLRKDLLPNSDPIGSLFNNTIVRYYIHAWSSSRLIFT